ncbi:MAG TPA: DUF58 domain-containing protein [bacterium]|nr:DUF58 domain-containing protein [bacterium]HQO33217.1 DUF58 domain-containing protein [bacterium]HQP96986.1 DUF58 domain-containing protein [bacterium]
MVDHGRKYLDPALLSKLGNMELVARCAVEGFYTGLHPSPFHGFSVEYSDHRAYEPGDELRFLDWKLYGRTDKLYIKQFQQETNVPVYLLLDCSNSMSFKGNGPVSKLEYGCYLASALAYLMLGQGDAVGLALLGDKVHARIPPRSRRTHLNTILTALQKHRAAGVTRLGDVLHTIAETTHRRGIVILISDLLDNEEELHTGLAHLKYLRHDVILFHTLDHQELYLDYDGLIEFLDLESTARIRTFTNSLRDSYRSNVKAFLETVEKESREIEIDYCLLDTSQPLDKAFLAYLARRKVLS